MSCPYISELRYCPVYEQPAFLGPLSGRGNPAQPKKNQNPGTFHCFNGDALTMAEVASPWVHLLRRGGEKHLHEGKTMEQRLDNLDQRRIRGRTDGDRVAHTRNQDVEGSERGEVLRVW
jgi:hypothetical protein